MARTYVAPVSTTISGEYSVRGVAVARELVLEKDDLLNSGRLSGYLKVNGRVGLQEFPPFLLLSSHTINIAG